MEKLRYPIGKFEKVEQLAHEIIDEAIATLADFPVRLSIELDALSEQQLDALYRPQGWSLRQLVHHCADSHMNALVRLKLALTEENPIIKPYEESLWAELADSKIPVAASLSVLQGVHARWVCVLRSLSGEDFSRVYTHPQHGTRVRIDEMTMEYAWHCKHHLAHITTTKSQNGWK